MDWIKGIWNFLSWVLVALMGACALLLIGSRLMGYHPYAVLSGSMEPTYRTGDLIFVKAADPETIRPGDPITFRFGETTEPKDSIGNPATATEGLQEDPTTTEGLQGNPEGATRGDARGVATHRVISVDAEGRCFYTQGDANDTPDGEPVPFDNLLGVPRFSLPLLGYLVRLLRTVPGKLAAAGGILLLILGILLPRGNNPC